LLYLDNLKGFLILLVVLGHCIQATDVDYDNNLVFRYIYSFHMPLFMFVSGFVSYRSQMKWQTVRRRFVQLIVPFLAWALLACCLNLDLTILPKTILHPDSGLWFLWALFFIVLGFKLCEMVSERLRLPLDAVVAVASLMLMGVMVAWRFKLFGFQHIAWYFPFYSLGHFCRKHFQHIEQTMRRMQWPMLAVFLAMAWFWMRKDPPTFLSTGNRVIYHAYKYATAIVACAAFLPLFRCLADRRMPIITKMGGGKTLGLYAIHQSIIMITVRTIGQPFSDGVVYTTCVLLLWAFVFAVSYAVYFLLDKNSYTALVFLGKRKSHIC